MPLAQVLLLFLFRLGRLHPAESQFDPWNLGKVGGCRVVGGEAGHVGAFLLLLFKLNLVGLCVLLGCVSAELDPRIQVQTSVSVGWLLLALVEVVRDGPERALFVFNRPLGDLLGQQLLLLAAQLLLFVELGDDVLVALFAE